MVGFFTGANLLRGFYWQKYGITKQSILHISKDPSILQGGLVLEPLIEVLILSSFCCCFFFWEEWKKKTVFDKSVNSLTILERVYNFNLKEQGWVGAGWGGWTYKTDELISSEYNETNNEKNNENINAEVVYSFMEWITSMQSYLDIYFS